MENANWIDCRQAKQMDLVAYLRSLGYEPQKIKGGNAWYHSPFREEGEPSFKINLSMNRWYDFGEGKGGDLVEFGTRYFKCSVGDFLLRLNNGPSQSTKPFAGVAAKSSEPQITIDLVKSLTHAGLTDYLTQRKIPLSLAGQYCKEVHYFNGGKKYFAIGFPNDSGGYELRNRYFKGASTPKDISRIGLGYNNVAVVEGFMDMLSYLQLKSKWDQPGRDILVLNSLSFVERALPVLQNYNEVALLLDGNAPGLKATEAITQAIPKAVSYSHLFSPYDDINEYHQHTDPVSQKLPQKSRKLRR
ncbi:toprim domain-containing protein [Taibaiella koreensis]|uniref:toprim domain-containing protein n=1 Tax=Taibaiella koreensis TaxID=1268548 RepID=UPI000E599581|nr:toprim domain-containing protein [Taibaiella koreensis]